MRGKQVAALLISGAAAGTVSGMFGAGGGLVLVPLLTLLTDLDDQEIFPVSICVILPVCVVSLVTTAILSGLHRDGVLPYLLGSAVGGFFSGKYGHRIPIIWLHRGLGILVLWGGIRHLC